MALEGKIKDFGITDILQLIGMQKKTGVLTLTSDTDTVTVTFDEGMVVAAEAYQKGKSYLLGEVLVQSEFMADEDLQKALSIQKETGQKLGHILVQERMIGSEDLASMVQLQVRETVYRIFVWKEGNYRFDQAPVIYDKENMIPISCEKILMEAMRIMDEWPLIRKVVSSPSLLYKKTDEKRKVKVEDQGLDEDIDKMFEEEAEEKTKTSEGAEEALGKDFPLTLSEERIYSLVDGKRSVQKLTYAGRIGEFETSKALYSLVSAGLIQPIGEEASAVTEVVEAEEDRGGRGRKILRNLAAYAIMLLLGTALVVYSREPRGDFLLSLTGTMAVRFQPLKYVHAVEEMNRILFTSYVYFLDEQSFPGSLEDLVKKGILDEKGKWDPWGTPYRFEVNKRTIHLSSVGRDRQEQTEDDLIREGSF